MSAAQLAGVMQRAISMHQSGALAEAEALYRQVLSANAKHVDANYLLGMLYYQAGHFQQAVALLQNAVALRPSAEYLLNLGAALMALGRAGDAEQVYRRALAANPRLRSLNFNLGVLLQAQLRWQEAEMAFKAELALQPGDIDSLYNLVVTLLAMQRAQDAEVHARQMVSTRPRDWRGHGMLGSVLARLDRMPEAHAALEQANMLVSRPGGQNVAQGGQYFLGCIHWELGQWDEAARAFGLVAQTDANSTDARLNLAAVLLDADKPEQALPVLQQLLQRVPAHIDAQVAMASALLKQGDFAAARDCAVRALTSLQAGPQSLAPGRGTADSRYTLGLILLTLGHFRDGWALNEWRFSPWRKDRRIVRAPQFTFPLPMWQGEPLQGKTILLVPEQGHGDEIQFARFVTLLKQQGANVWLFTKAPLIGLLRSVPGVDRVLQEGDPLQSSDLDYWVFPLSLPQRFAVECDSIPAPRRYLESESAKLDFWRNWLRHESAAPAGQRFVGLVWAGNPRHKNDANRSLAFAELLPLLDIPGITFVSLQMGERAGDPAAVGVAERMLHAGPNIRDFSDSAALVDALDLLITVDSAPAHLAGALGRTVWTLLPRVPDWRWLIDCDDSPWYPAMRLFRQPQVKDWRAVVAELEYSLRQWVGQ